MFVWMKIEYLCGINQTAYHGQGHGQCVYGRVNKGGMV